MGVPQVSPGVGSPIRESPDRRLRAPTRSVSQLATPFVSAQADPSVRWRIRPSPLGTHVRFASYFLRLPLHSTSSWTLELSRVSLSPSSLSRHVLRVAF